MEGFICEALVSGGPRHGGEKDLCEDSSGVITTASGAVFYLADATSDEGRIGSFSSRYLANSLGHWFLGEGLTAMNQQADSLDLDRVFNAALDNMQAAWIKEWSAYSRKPGALEEFNKRSELYRSERYHGHVKSFSTTFLGGVIMARSRRVAIVRTGDIDLVVKHMYAEPSHMGVRKERIFAQIIMKNGGAPEMRFADTIYELYSAGLVEYIIAKTDGIRFVNDELTIKALDGGVAGVRKFRQILLKGIRSDTGDDKALFYCAFL